MSRSAPNLTLAVPQVEEKQTEAHRKRSIRAYLAVHRPVIGRLIQGEFEIRTLSEAERLATMLASHCPDPENTAIGLWELLCNAIEHGNYDIDCEQKAALLRQGLLHEELEHRSVLPPYCDRVVKVNFRQSSKRIEIRIEDEGRGFDFARYLAVLPFSEAPNGRGIAMARALAFSTLNYQGAGNIAIATIGRERAG